MIWVNTNAIMGELNVQEEAEASVAEWYNMGKDQLLLLASKTERVQEPKCWQPLEAGKAKEMDSSLELPEDMQPPWHLDFSPVKPISNFWPPKL